MTLTHLTPADYVTTQWSGGATTQLAIAPKGAVYADRDFLWRLSSATVELDESDFTPLPAYDRVISTLRAGMETLTLAAHESALIEDAPAQLTVEGSAKLMLAQMYR